MIFLFNNNTKSVHTMKSGLNLSFDELFACDSFSEMISCSKYYSWNSTTIFEYVFVCVWQNLLFELLTTSDSSNVYFSLHVIWVGERKHFSHFWQSRLKMGAALQIFRTFFICCLRKFVDDNQGKSEGKSGNSCFCTAYVSLVYFSLFPFFALNSNEKFRQQRVHRINKCSTHVRKIVPAKTYTERLWIELPFFLGASVFFSYNFVCFLSHMTQSLNLFPNFSHNHGHCFHHFTQEIFNVASEKKQRNRRDLWYANKHTEWE